MKGGTGAIVEYFGPGAESISATGKAHDLQHGRRDRRHLLAVRATTHNMAAYLKATGREAIADLADKVAEHLRIDPDDGAERSTTS